MKAMHRSLLLIPVVLVAACAKEAPSDHIRVSGHVEATEVRLGPDAGGRILTLTVKEGDHVTLGQPILTLDARDIELAMKRAEADRAQADAHADCVAGAGRRMSGRRNHKSTSPGRRASRHVELQSAEQDPNASKHS